MKFAVLQIGDIHFKEKGNFVANRVKQIRQAFQSLSAEIEACVIAVAGDVAHSGQENEYNVAEKFFAELREQIGSIRPSLPVEFVLVPGNHDCNLSGDQELRDELIDGIPEKLPTLDPSKSVVRQILQAQDGFFAFLSRFQGVSARSGAERLYYEQIVEIGSVHLRFNCYNTAWLARMSQRDRPKVPLHYPVRVAQDLAEARADEVDFVVSIFHYPYGWLDPDNAMPFKRLVDSTSDFILTGHEHSSSGYRKEFSTGGETFYSEGDALQQFDPPHSGFNVILFDLESGQMRHAHFAWDGSVYAPSAEERWLPLKKNSLIKRPRFQLTDEFGRELNEEGYGFRHPRVRASLNIRDLFVYPDLIEQKIDQMIAGRSTRRNIEGSKIHEYLNEHPLTILLGEHQIGKTTLGKILYADTIERGLHPVLFAGLEAKATEEKRFLRALRRAYEAQYAFPAFETYRLLDKDERVLIVDEFHLSPLNTKGRDEFLKLTAAWFGHVIIMANELFTLEMLRVQGGSSFIHEFRHCTIRQLGWRKRNHLIKRWLKLGREMTVTDAEIEPDRKALADTLDNVLGKNVFPATPFIVISALQSYEAARGHAVGSGAIGYIYEALITTAVHKISTRPSDLERIYAFLSQIAYQMFLREKSELSEHQIREIADEYFRRMGVAYDVPKLLSDLIGAHIMRADSSHFRFEPRHFYYYFVARYFNDNLYDPKQAEALRAKIGEMIDTVHFEDYAHVLNFLIYFVKEPWMFERMRDNARRIYAYEQPCDLTTDVEFVNRMMTEVKPLELPATTTEENQDMHLGMRDNLERETAELKKTQPGAKVQYSDDADDLIKLNIAFKTLDLMGQVVRNYPYTLPGDTKEELIVECELLALRTMKAVLRIAEGSLEKCQAYYTQLIREQRALESELQSIIEADQLLMWLTGAVGYSIVKRVSMAVGAQELDQIYRRVVKNLHHLLGARMIDVAIQFDHLTAPPVSEVEELSEVTRKNPFAYSLLRDLVADFLYLHHTDERTRKKLGAAVEIKVTDPKILDNPGKRLSLPPTRVK